MLLSSYVRSCACVEKSGANIAAAIKVDGTILAIAVSSRPFSFLTLESFQMLHILQTSEGNLIFLKLQYEKLSTVSASVSRRVYSTREHGM